ncbi:hypothetical protein AKI39_04580 [Bordetella sp. H567]|uniref:hypothetical protein n=1 Tax=Bordetella sp. H567 TaxID=1697043 RepID=UPI00081C6268|nr:hypothetical protein [Bordetella sp. H567]AOB30122.1 hypothetical protein AKI39_04580 [Bordetella sp. H567]
MAISILESLTGDTIPIGSKNIQLMVATDGPGTVKFAYVSGPTLTGMPTSDIPIQSSTAGSVKSYYAEVGDLQVSATTTAGTFTLISATPYDEQHNAGTVKQIKLTYQAYTDISGTVPITNTGFVTTPADKDAPGGYWRVAMEAQNSAGNAALGGAMVRFTAQPSNNIDVWSDIVDIKIDPPPPRVLLQPVGSFYYVPTDPATGQAAVRIVTKATVFNQAVECLVAMNGINEIKNTMCYFARNDDPQADYAWIPPSAAVNQDGNIQIPEYGDQFNLNVSVNNEDNGTYVRYVVMNDTTAFAYDLNLDGVLPVDYSSLIQDPAGDSNKFTYVRMNKADGNVKASPPFDAGVDGSRANLPNPKNTPRVAPPPLVTPDPGTDKTIALGTLSAFNTLRLDLTDFSASLLTGYTGGELTVEFKCYMNGYKQSGEDRPSQVYSSVTQSSMFTTVPTVAKNGSTIKFSEAYVELSYGAALDWGRNPFTSEMKKVGFEYIIRDGTGQKWYSTYDPSYSWYRISTGNW